MEIKTKGHRLQGKAWYDKKESLNLIEYVKNSKGHIMGTYEDANGNLFWHWLSDKEIVEVKDLVVKEI